MVKVTTRGHKRSLQAHSLCLNRKKDPQPESLGTLKLSSSFSLAGSPFAGNSAFDRLALPFLLYLRFRRSSRCGRGWPSARGTGG